MDMAEDMVLGLRLLDDLPESLASGIVVKMSLSRSMSDEEINTFWHFVNCLPKHPWTTGCSIETDAIKLDATVFQQYNGRWYHLHSLFRIHLEKYFVVTWHIDF